MATFKTGSDHQFKFVNHTRDSQVNYDLNPATGGDFDIKGEVKPGQTVESTPFNFGRTLEQGNVPVFTISGAPSPKFRFWSGSGGQFINLNAGDGYVVRTDTSEISEVVGNGFRVTVDGGGVNNPSVKDIWVQIYNEGPSA